jgi:hypothetical protein
LTFATLQRLGNQLAYRIRERLMACLKSAGDPSGSAASSPGEKSAARGGGAERMFALMQIKAGRIAALKMHREGPLQGPTSW